jgi:hypothetical protein
MIGGFLDTMPAWLFILAHVLFLAIGLWAAKTAMDKKVKYAKAFWLYPLVHLGFLSFFLFGAITFKMAVLVEQMLIVVMVAWIAKEA